MAESSESIKMIQNVVSQAYLKRSSELKRLLAAQELFTQLSTEQQTLNAIQNTVVYLGQKDPQLKARSIYTPTHTHNPAKRRLTHKSLGISRGIKNNHIPHILLLDLESLKPWAEGYQGNLMMVPSRRVSGCQGQW